MPKNVLPYYVQLLQMTLLLTQQRVVCSRLRGVVTLLFYLIKCCFISVPSASFLTATGGS